MLLEKQQLQFSGVEVGCLGVGVLGQRQDWKIKEQGGQMWSEILRRANKAYQWNESG